MCGIWGAVNLADEEIARQAVTSIRHRGPDDEGVWIDEDQGLVSLGNTRLAIIDLSPSGHMPMANEDGRYWIAYNGEVYNFQPLRKILEELGHQFRSTSDTEVILHAYMEWGEQCLDYLRGMFAFAIWDKQEEKLFAARDRLGIKPLYYSVIRSNDESILIFGSELKALLSTGFVEPRLNYSAVHHYMSFYAVPSPYTMLDGIKVLPPGYYLTYKDEELSIHKYWEISAGRPFDLSEEDLIQQLRELLEESIRLRMIADVPVGAFLSGGVDSSAVVALMTRISGERLKTFSIGFEAEGRNLDERSDARVIAQKYETDHTEVIVSGQQVRDSINHIVRAMDQPSGDGLNTYLVSQATAKHVKVALSGLGGDELFAGYPQFRMFQQAELARNLWKRIPASGQRILSIPTNLSPRLSNAKVWLDGTLLERYERVRVLYNEEAKLDLYTDQTCAKLAAPEQSLAYLEQFVFPTENDPISQITRLELKNYMAHTLLRDTDAMSMAHSLEVRVPLIDHKLVEFATRIPSNLKIRQGKTKWIFTKALEDVLPPEVINRPKRGFEMPISSWMKNELEDIVEETLSHTSVSQRGLFKPEAVVAEYEQFKQGRTSYVRIWSLVMLELWMREFIDGRSR